MHHERVMEAASLLKTLEVAVAALRYINEPHGSIFVTLQMPFGEIKVPLDEDLAVSAISNMAYGSQGRLVILGVEIPDHLKIQ